MAKRMSAYYRLVIVLYICTWTFQMPVYAYSVLTHEAIIDVCWEKDIQPLLLEKYPVATKEQLKDAHAYAYGGSVAPDMGYYPFGSKLFTDLVHYVRTGDFVQALLEEAHDVNEYAFALGVLCHYNADKYGHPLATNRCVPLAFPKIKEKFGTTVTYEEDPVSHVRMEFGFDVIQTARGNYASGAYHDFIGFKVSRPVLERAFVKTYGLDINDVFKDLSLSIETFRWLIKNLMPTITKAAWAAKRSDIRKANPAVTRKAFEYKMRRANYYHEFGKKHERPGFGPTVVAAVVKVLPKVGKLKTLKIKIPGADAEKLFIQSFDTVVVHFKAALAGMRHGGYLLTNVDYDTGHETSAGEYGLADKCYIQLLLKLQEGGFKKTNSRLRQNILHFYSSCNEKTAAMAGTQQWQEVTKAIELLSSTRQ